MPPACFTNYKRRELDLNDRGPRFNTHRGNSLLLDVWFSRSKASDVNKDFKKNLQCWCGGKSILPDLHRRSYALFSVKVHQWTRLWSLMPYQIWRRDQRLRQFSLLPTRFIKTPGLGDLGERAGFLSDQIMLYRSISQQRVLSLKDWVSGCCVFESCCC